MCIHRLLFVLLIGLFVCVHRAKADRTTTFREFKVVETPSSSSDDANRNDRNDVSFYVDADEHLGKLTSQAVELRDTFNELIKNAFGRELRRNLTTLETPIPNATAIETDQTASEEVGAASRASADWVRAAINPMLLMDKPSTQNSSETSVQEATKPKLE